MQVTKLLRELLNGKKSVWTPEFEDSCKMINNIINSETVLGPFDPYQHTIMIADAAPQGIAASIYQVDKEGVWVAVDHASRCLSFSNSFVHCHSLLWFPKTNFCYRFYYLHAAIYIWSFTSRSFLLIISRLFLNTFLSSFCCKSFPLSKILAMSFPLYKSTSWYSIKVSLYAYMQFWKLGKFSQGKISWGNWKTLLKLNKI